MSAGTGSDRPSGIAAASDAERRLRTDPLTQIASKVQLLEWLEGRDAGLLALLDVDDFRILNHSLGHDFGDASLQVLARRLETANAGPGRHVARLGQDEFAVLSAPDETAERFGRRLQAVFAEPFRIGDRQVRLRATYGISRCSTNKAPNDVIREADTAMYEAKTRFRGSGLVFDDAFQQRAFDILEFAEGLRHALDQGDLEVHYQPQVDLGSAGVTGVEALLRWTHPTRGPVSPVDFIPIAEAGGLIDEIGLFVLRTAVAQRCAWLAAGEIEPRFVVGVNVSPRQLEAPEFVEAVRWELESTDCPPDRLCLELTEGAIMADPTTAAARLGELAELGAQISIDDFGTGHSSLAYLLELPIGQLKIDRSFVMQVHEPRGRKLTSAIIGLARSLGLECVGEGIESELHHNLLRDLGCDIGQGYFHGRPMTAAAMTEALRASRPAAVVPAV